MIELVEIQTTSLSRMAAKFETVDQYIASHTPDVQDMLRQTRQAIVDAGRKDGLTFPYSKPIPFDLIHRVAEVIVAKRRA